MSEAQPLGIACGDRERGRGGRWTLSVLARLRGHWLDRQLATGVPPRSRMLLARSRQLTSHRRRAALADSLEHILELTERPQRAGLSSALPVNRKQVAEARPTINALVSRLTGPRSVDACGVAMLTALLSDGTGPLFAPGSRAALREGLEEALRHL